jgi:DNA polymerase III delta prime subunit
MILTEKYKPKEISELLQVEQSKKIISRISDYQKPILIYGPTGAGKTITVHTIASHLNHEILEINASDVRNSDSVNEIV